MDEEHGPLAKRPGAASPPVGRVLARRDNLLYRTTAVAYSFCVGLKVHYRNRRDVFVLDRRDNLLPRYGGWWFDGTSYCTVVACWFVVKLKGQSTVLQ